MNIKKSLKNFKKKTLWLIERLNLGCPKPKCFNCEITANCNVCIRDYKYDLCKTSKNHNTRYSKSCKFDACAH